MLREEVFYRVLDIWGTRMVEDMRNELMRNGSISTSRLYNSLSYDIRESLDQYVLTFNAEDYAQYVENGTSGGGWVPISKMKQWCKYKGIPEEAAFAIRRNIFKFGIKPKPFMSPSINKNMDGFILDLVKYVSQDVADSAYQDLVNTLRISK